MDYSKKVVTAKNFDHCHSSQHQNTDDTAQTIECRKPSHKRANQMKKSSGGIMLQPLPAKK